MLQLISSGSSGITILSLLLLLELPHLPSIQNLDLWLPLLHISPQKVRRSNRDFLLAFSIRIVTERNQIPRRFFDIQKRSIFDFNCGDITILAIVLKLFANLMSYFDHEFVVQIELPKSKDHYWAKW